jgi:uncharacterized protein (TIGR03067 family)
MYALLFLAAGLVAAQDKKGDLAKMEGTWEVVAAEAQGNKAPAEQLKQAKLRLTIKGDQFTYKSNDMTFAEGSIKLDEAKTPRAIDVKGKDPTGKEIGSTGIYEIEGDTMKVCFVEKGDRPTKFETKEGSPAQIVTYKRVKE